MSNVSNEKDWPRNSAELLMLPELGYEIMLRHRENRASYPPGTMTQVRDQWGDLWRVYDLEDVGLRRVRIG